MLDLATHVLVIAGIYGLLTLSLNLQYGLAGLLNFGHVALWALGAFTVAITHRAGLPLWVGLLLGPVVGVAGGLVMAAPVKRLRQEYWALLTLAVAELFRAVMMNEPAIAGGTMGTRGIRVLAPPRAMIVILALLILATVVALERLRRSQFGRVIRVMREDPLLVASTGRRPERFQYKVMGIGGGIAAIAGVAYAHYTTFVSPDQFILMETFIIWVMMVVGGIANNYGAVLGAVGIQTLLVSTRFTPDWLDFGGELNALFRLIIIGSLVVLMIMYRPNGLISETRNSFHAPS